MKIVKKHKPLTDQEKRRLIVAALVVALLKAVNDVLELLQNLINLITLLIDK